MDPTLDLDSRVEDLLQRLTFMEKCLLSTGEKGGKGNLTAPIPRLGIPRFKTTDGPHGVAPYAQDHPNATYFPTGIQMASTWNPRLLVAFGEAIAEEVRAIGYHGILGPAVNIARTPMNGRTFEYYSEDPYLSGEMGAAAIQGIQNRKVGACVKHFVANNQENGRHYIDVQVSPRALQELYYPAFKTCVQKGGVWTVMSSYNKINGLYAAEHKELLRDTLMDQWQFPGAVISDWGGTARTGGIAKLIEAGLSVDMGPLWEKIYKPSAMQALKDAGGFPEAVFDDNLRRYLRVMFLCGVFDDPSTLPPGSINTPAHRDVARQLAAEGAVLLKNDGNVLPLDINAVHKIALLGRHADMKFARGGGSSAVGAAYEFSLREGLEQKCQGKVAIVDDPAGADAAVVCVGLGHSFDWRGGDHEGRDRLRYGLGYQLPRLVNRVAKLNPRTIVVCVNGSPFGMESFVSNVPAVLEAWYGGAELGNVVADILFGDVNPSGKLPISFPKSLKDVPAHKSHRTYPGRGKVYYEEGIFVGYRHLDIAGIAPRFPFGHGLSYTQFTFGNLVLSAPTIIGGESIAIGFEVSNVGDRGGQEVAQLYVQDLAASVPRPTKELRRFAKVQLSPGETTQVHFELSHTDLAYFDEATGAWAVADGEFKVLVGNSSRDLPLEG